MIPNIHTRTADTSNIAKVPLASAKPFAKRSMVLHLDLVLTVLLGVGVLCLYMSTLLPGVGRRDTAEFQWVAPTLGLAHPTGYPLYTVVGWLWSKLAIGGTVAWRMNLLSAVFGSMAVTACYAVARRLCQSRLVAVVSASVFATSLTFWSQATIAEVYTLAILLQFALLLALLGWRDHGWPLWITGVVAGLMLSHHRSSVLILPCAAVFVLFHTRGFALGMRTKAILAAVGAATLGCGSYAYLLLHLPANSDLMQFLWTYAVASDFAGNWFDPTRFLADPVPRLTMLFTRFVWSQFLPIGFCLCMVGAVALLRRDWTYAMLLLGGYVLTFAFCAAYYVDDIEVFLLTAHGIAALLLGEGLSSLERLVHKLGRRRDGGNIPQWLVRWRVFYMLLFLFPAALLLNNIGLIRTQNMDEAELAARAVLAQPLPPNAVIIGDWYATEGVRYLQLVEGVRPDIELGTVADRSVILDQLAHGRHVYLIEPKPELGLGQLPDGHVWRVLPQHLGGDTSVHVSWQAGMTLDAFTLPAKPYQSGDTLALTLSWHTSAPVLQKYRLFVHIVGEDGLIVGQHDREPSIAPTTQWLAESEYTDLYAPQLDAKTKPGRYHVVIGWYDPETMQRVPLAAPLSNDYVILGSIEVR